MNKWLKPPDPGEMFSAGEQFGGALDEVENRRQTAAN